jgi:hypothetical protein
VSAVKIISSGVPMDILNPWESSGSLQSGAPEFSCCRALHTPLRRFCPEVSKKQNFAFDDSTSYPRFRNLLVKSSLVAIILAVISLK